MKCVRFFMMMIRKLMKRVFLIRFLTHIFDISFRWDEMKNKIKNERRNNASYAFQEICLVFEKKEEHSNNASLWTLWVKSIRVNL